jgi:hypothetical protein
MNAPDENLRFDRLADGELSEQERRELLSGLDDEPGGWRRCALAFLEAQCWRQSLGGFVFGEGGKEERPAPAVARAASRPLRRSLWFSRLGTAAAMAASFAAAVWLVTWAQHNQVAEMPRPDEKADQVAKNGDVEPNQLDRQWLQNTPPAIPENVAQALERTGHEVRQRREFVPVSLEDGRQMVMPVDHVDVHYVGNRTY